MATDDHYRRSEAYSRTISTRREQTNAALYQRDPLACWYAAGTATVQSPPPQTSTLTLACAVKDNLWNTVRVPGQILTFVAQGQLVHAPLLPVSTQTTLVLQLPSPVVLANGSALPYMIRAKAPRTTLLGPVVQTGPNTVVVQAHPGSVPMPHASLVYLGGRSSHPVHTCAMQSPTVARNHVYAVLSVTPLGPTMALRSVPLADPTVQLEQVTPHLAVGSIRLSTPAALTGLVYEWPYPVDQTGDVWLLTPTQNSGPIGPPQNVWVVRAAGPIDAAPVVDGVSLVNGDRVLELGTGDGMPIAVHEWDAPVFRSIPFPSADPFLVIVDGGATHSRKAWCRDIDGPFRGYTVTARAPHPVPAGSGVVDVALDSSLSTPPLVSHALVLLVRSSDGLYAPQPS